MSPLRTLPLAHILQVLLPFLEELFTLLAVGYHPHDAARNVLGAEVEFVVKLLHRTENLLVGEVGIVDDAGLVASVVDVVLRGDPTLPFAEVPEFGSGIWGGQDA